MRDVNIINNIFTEFRLNRNQIEITVEAMKKEISSFSNKIVIYGAGSSGIAFLYDLRKIGIEPLYFADADSSKIGMECEGLKIIAPNEIIQKAGEDSLIIICINTDGKRYCKSYFQMGSYES